MNKEQLLNEFDEQFPAVNDIQKAFRREALLILIEKLCGQSVK